MGIDISEDKVYNISIEIIVNGIHKRPPQKWLSEGACLLF